MTTLAQDIPLRPVGWVRSPRTQAIDDDWDSITSTITLDEQQFSATALHGLDAFSHVDVVYHFHLVEPEKVQTGARHPRGNHDWPSVGVFAQRAKARPNRIGVTTCRLLDVDGLSLTVHGLDAVDGTPVLDIKPHMREFEARGDVHQPAWSHELMAEYWIARTS